MAIQNTRNQGLDTRKKYLGAATDASFFTQTSPQPRRSPLPPRGIGGGGGGGGSRGAPWGRGQATGQESMIHQELQSRREADLRSWAELALKERGLDFSQNMVSRQADHSEWLQNQREGRDQEEFNFGMGRAQAKGGQEDEMHGLRIQHLGDEEDRTQTRFNFDMERDHVTGAQQDARHSFDLGAAQAAEGRRGEMHVLDFLGASEDLRHQETIGPLKERGQRLDNAGQQQQNRQARFLERQERAVHEIHGPLGAKAATATGVRGKSILDEAPYAFYNAADALGYDTSGLLDEEGPTTHGLRYSHELKYIKANHPGLPQEQAVDIAAQRAGVPTREQSLEREIASLEAEYEEKGSIIFWDSPEARGVNDRLTAAKAELEGIRGVQGQAGAMGQGAGAAGQQGAAGPAGPPQEQFKAVIDAPEFASEMQELFNSDQYELQGEMLGKLIQHMKVDDDMSAHSRARIWDLLPTKGRNAAFWGFETNMIKWVPPSPTDVLEELGVKAPAGQASRVFRTGLISSQHGVSIEDAQKMYDAAAENVAKSKALPGALTRIEKVLKSKMEEIEHQATLAEKRGLYLND